jgi:hypothetical protein
MPYRESIPLPPLEIRDAVFQELIRISPASNYREELVTGPGGLLSRGLPEEQAAKYGALSDGDGTLILVIDLINVSIC